MIKIKNNLDVKIYHNILSILPFLVPRFLWRLVGAVLFRIEIAYLEKLRPHLGSVSERLLEYTWVLAQLRGGNDSILDVGSGDSLLPYALIRRGYKLYSIDIGYYPGIRKLLQKRFYQADVTEAPFVENFFDKVIAISTIEHIDDDIACMRELLRILKPGGKVFISVPLGFSFYNLSTLPRLEISGLSVVNKDYYIREDRAWKKLSMSEASSINNLTGIATLILEKDKE